MILRYCDASGRRKVSYPTRDEAEDARDRLLERNLENPRRVLRVYPCPDCGAFHCGRVKLSSPRRGYMPAKWWAERGT